MIVRARVAREDVAREQHQLAVGIDDLAVLGDDAQAVAVAVEGQAELGVGGLHGADQVGQVLGLARVRVVVREVAVDLGVQLGHVAAERAQDARRRRARDAVAGIDHDLHRRASLQSPTMRCAVLGAGCPSSPTRPRPVHVVLGLDALAQALDLVAVDRAAGQHHLEAVVVLRVVAAGDLDAAVAAVLAARGGHVVQHRRRHRADVDHVEPGRRQAADQRGAPAPAPTGARRARPPPPARPRPRASLPKARPRCSANASSIVWPTMPRMS